MPHATRTGSSGRPWAGLSPFWAVLSVKAHFPDKLPVASQTAQQVRRDQQGIGGQTIPTHSRHYSRFSPSIVFKAVFRHFDVPQYTKYQTTHKTPLAALKTPYTANNYQHSRQPTQYCYNLPILQHSSQNYKLTISPKHKRKPAPAIRPERAISGYTIHCIN